MSTWSKAQPPSPKPTDLSLILTNPYSAAQSQSGGEAGSSTSSVGGARQWLRLRKTAIKTLKVGGLGSTFKR